MKETNVIEKAAKIALKAHDGQVRKHDGSPYIVHPFMVALKVARHGFDETVIAAALVHDVLEDSDISEKELRGTLGDKIVDIVKTVTYPENLEWKEKRLVYIRNVSEGSVGAKVVSVADKIHNLENLLEMYEQEGASLWEKFNRGRTDKLWSEETLLQSLKKVWAHPLLDEYDRLVECMKDTK